MRAVIQRVSEASVEVEGEIVGAIERGLCVLIGAGQDDQESDVRYLADKIATLRIFPDEEGKMNLSVLDVGGGVLAVSQFTLYGDARKGRRPSFVAAGEPGRAEALYEQVVERLCELGVSPVETGRFRTHMNVSLVNDGPVTILLDSKKQF
jgi:D-tyrosyl-tRNA(Tyr) deacylase